MSDRWNLLTFQGYNGSAQIHGPTTIGPIIWNFVNGWNKVGRMIQSDLVTGIIEMHMLNSYHNWYAIQPMSVEMGITF